MTRDHSAESLAEEKFRLTVEACPSGIVISDSAGVILLVNSATERMFGYRRDELIGQHIGILLPKRLHAEYFKDRAEYLQHPGEHRFYEGRALSCLRRDGSEFPVEVELNPIHTGESLTVLSSVTDIGERERLDRAKDEFVFNVSHELRTPLTSIAGSLGLLLGGAAGQLPQQAAQLLTIAHNNCQRLLRLINDILDIEKAESGKMEFHFKRLDLRALVEHVLEANRAYADGFGVTLRLDPDAAGAEVYADPDRLAQVITNLLSNAVKFSPVHGQVSLSIAKRKQAIRLAVRDHGPGIPKEFRPRLFEKFAQAETTDARQKGGAGLGLSIVKQIVARLGGTVGFEDAEGGGTIFYVELPSWAAIAAHEIDTERTADYRHILLCEADIQSALLRRNGLHKYGFSSDFAYSAADAITRAQANEYAALVVDLDLADGGGRELLRQLRAQPHLYRTPIIVIAAGKQSGKSDTDSTDLNIQEWIDKRRHRPRRQRAAANFAYRRRSQRARTRRASVTRHR